MDQNFFQKTPKQALEQLQVTSDGLTSAQAAQRLAQYGPNQLAEGKKKSVLAVFAEQFKDLLVAILIAAALISMFSGNLESTLVIFAVLILNAILGTVQYFKAEKVSGKPESHERPLSQGAAGRPASGIPAIRSSPVTSSSWRPATLWWPTAVC